MTGNRTTELINDRVNRLLYEAGADFTIRSLMTNGTMESYDKFTVLDADKMPIAQIETSFHNDETVLLTLRCTPEQAVAATLGSRSASIDNVLELLDEMHLNAEISYTVYSRLHDAIATLGSGTCEDEAEPDGWHKCPECGCVVGYWLLNDDSWTIYMDDYQIPFNNCPNCGKAVKR